MAKGNLGGAAENYWLDLTPVMATSLAAFQEEPAATLASPPVGLTERLADARVPGLSANPTTGSPAAAGAVVADRLGDWVVLRWDPPPGQGVLLRADDGDIKACPVAESLLADAPLPSVSWEPDCTPGRYTVRSEAGALVVEGRRLDDAGLALWLVGRLDAMPNRQIDALIAILRGLAHSHSNRLQVITGIAGTLELDPASAADSEMIEDLNRATAQSIRLVEQLRACARGARPELEEVSLDQLIESVVEEFETTVEEPVELALELASPAVVLADEVVLRRAIANLVANAVEAMPSGGTVTVSLTAHDSAYEPWLIAVSDTGPGLAADWEQRAFEPFRTTKPADDHPGLGLSVARYAFTGHGGWLAHDPTHTAGARFVATLPRWLH